MKGIEYESENQLWTDPQPAAPGDGFRAGVILLRSSRRVRRLVSKFHGAHGAQRLAARRSRKREGAARALRRAIPCDPARWAPRRNVLGGMYNVSFILYSNFHCLQLSDITYRTLSPDSDSSRVYRHPSGLVARSETCNPLSVSTSLFLRTLHGRLRNCSTDLPVRLLGEYRDL